MPNDEHHNTVPTTRSGFNIPDGWRYPRREPYRACCGTPLDIGHASACMHHNGDDGDDNGGGQALCPSCEMVGFHAAGCPRMTGTDPVSRPAHYLHPSGIETIGVNRCMTFDCGSAFKYVLRFEDKDNPAQDLSKARWYVEDCRTHDDPLFLSPVHRARAAVLLQQMIAHEPMALRREFFEAIAELDVEWMAAVVDQLLVERTGGQITVTERVTTKWPGDEALMCQDIMSDVEVTTTQVNYFSVSHEEVDEGDGS